MRPISIAILVVAPALSWGCTNDVSGSRPGGSEDPDDPGADAIFGRSAPEPCGNCGGPLDRLGDEDQAAFDDGLEEFEEEEEVDEGLGPVFNDLGCGNCHDTPAVGGSGTTFVTRFGRVGNDGSFDPLADLGGSLRQDHGIGEVGKCGLPAEVTPARANVEAHRRTTPLFGLGLVDAVPDTILLFIAASQPKAVRGLPHWVDDIASGQRRIGRFGWKAQVATLRTFSGDAYLNEMGITSADFPNENCPQGDCTKLTDCDEVADPEDDGIAIDNFTAFMSFLAAPAPARLSARGRDGQKLFDRIGCADCHVATLLTGASDKEAFNFVAIHPYSDFLLHDMGKLGDGITQGAATGRLMRTAPLWGVSAQPSFLHDGRARTLGRAIRAHDGQAEPARVRYERLSFDERRAVVEFLRSL